MPVVDIKEATARLANLVDQVAGGEPFIIAKGGRPLVTVAASTLPKTILRLSFLAGKIAVPNDFGTMGQAEIEDLFGLGP